MNSDLTPYTPDDESCYTDGISPCLNVSFDNLASDRFSNISLLYSSQTGAMQLYTATRYGKRYILKCLKEKYKHNPVYKLALRKEFEIGMAIDHPNIRRTIGFEEIEGLGYTLILEHIDGENLDKTIAHNRIDAKNAYRIIKQIAEALENIHAHQIVHRDIKPSNIMITHSGKMVKIIDFSLSDSESFIILKNPAGTRKYMSPEQFQPESKATSKSDIYSFGMVIKDLATITKDQDLLQLSEACCNKIPEKRPELNDIITRLKKIQSRKSKILSIDSPKFTYLLICITVVLSAFVIYMFINRYIPASSASYAEPSNAISDNSNIKVMDIGFITEGDNSTKEQ